MSVDAELGQEIKFGRVRLQKTLMVNFTKVVSNFCSKVTFFPSNGDNNQNQNYTTSMQK